MRTEQVSHLVHKITFVGIIIFAVLLNVRFPQMFVNAEQVTATIPLSANQSKLSRLAPGQLSGQAIFLLDNSSSVTIDMISTFNALVTSIVGPKGQVLNANSIYSFGGQFYNYEGDAELTSLFILPMFSPGSHYFYSFPSLGPGNYTVNFKIAHALAEEVAIITQVVTNSTVASNLVATQSLMVLGDSVVLVAPLFEGQSPITSATVSVTTIQPDTGSPVNLLLQDDGKSPDSAAGDGLYSAEFVPQAVGHYKAVATINGTTKAGLLFSRNAATEFTVFEKFGQLTGKMSDQGIDDNSNGLFDRVAFNVEVNVAIAGDYQAFVHLKTSSGKDLVRSSEINLSTGIQNIMINFEAESFQGLKENGPYDIELVELVFLGDEGAILTDQISNAGQTQAYLLSQFERSPLILTGVISDLGVDDNGNGLFDRLLVSIQADVQKAGYYTWSLGLADQDRNEIDFSSSGGFWNAGLNVISVAFKGTSIGNHGWNGPYYLRNLLLQGTSVSLVESDVGMTSRYKASQFEGYIIGNGTICSTIGNNQNNNNTPDTDTFKFTGGKNEQVTIRLSPDGPYTSGKVTLMLTSGIKVVSKDLDALSKDITWVLPSYGQYGMSIIEQRWGNTKGFNGEYCLTLKSSGNAWQTLQATADVE